MIKYLLIIIIILNIIGITGFILNKIHKESYEIKEKKVITLLRDEIFFNTFVYGPLGVICENITPNQKPELKSLNINDHFQKDEFYALFEVFKKRGNVAILLNTMPSILASIAPPLWMLQNRLWTYFCITIIFYFCLFIISPWLFFIGWILKSWYVGNSQIDLLRFFYRLNNYRLSLSFCSKNEKEAQEIARKFDDKVDFDY